MLHIATGILTSLPSGRSDVLALKFSSDVRRLSQKLLANKNLVCSYEYSQGNILLYGSRDGFVRTIDLRARIQEHRGGSVSNVLRHNVCIRFRSPVAVDLYLLLSAAAATSADVS